MPKRKQDKQDDKKENEETKKKKNKYMSNYDTDGEDEENIVGQRDYILGWMDDHIETCEYYIQKMSEIYYADKLK